MEVVTRRHPNGGEMVDARWLHGQLGQDKSNFMRWCKRHFIEEEEAVEGLDYFKFEDEAYNSGPGGKFVKYRPVYGLSPLFAIRMCQNDNKYEDKQGKPVQDHSELIRELQLMDIANASEKPQRPDVPDGYIGGIDPIEESWESNELEGTMNPYPESGLPWWKYVGVLVLLAFAGWLLLFLTGNTCWPFC